MDRFAQLLDALLLTPSRNGKIALIADYFATTADPERGWALAALTGNLDFPTAKPAMIRALVADRTDPQLFAWSYDFVGDLAETVSLIWPAQTASAGEATRLSVSDVVARLISANRKEVPGLISEWLDRLAPAPRYALLKLVTGGLRVGASARLTRMALAEWSGRDLAAIEEVWHGLAPPYGDLFAWLSGNAPAPDTGRAARFRPLMLANPLETEDIARIDIQDYLAEWKWDGIRVQVAGAAGGAPRLFSRTGDDISATFPDLMETLEGLDAVLDGELLVVRADTAGDRVVAPFNDLQQRLNRKTVTRRMLTDSPAFVRLYDILVEGEEDLRALPLVERRLRLEALVGRLQPPRMDVSVLVAFDDLDDLAALRDSARDQGIEGLMLKRKDSPYTPGRPKGPWWKWKRAALTADCVLMYAQRGHGKRSSFYSDYTFGAWVADADAGGDRLVPVGKAYSGFTDQELVALDRWVRAHTTNRFGPVREVEVGLVVEVAFDSIHTSTRHKSGVAMRFPRIHRIRWDKPPEEADRLETLERHLT